MPSPTLTDHPLELLKERLEAGISATPLCLAIIGWLTGVPTEPAIAELRRATDGGVVLRLSEEAHAEPLCSFLEFLKEIRIICHALGLSETQTARVAAEVRQRLK